MVICDVSVRLCALGRVAPISAGVVPGTCTKPSASVNSERSALSVPHDPRMSYIARTIADDASHAPRHASSSAARAILATRGVAPSSKPCAV